MTKTIGIKFKMEVEKSSFPVFSHDLVILHEVIESGIYEPEVSYVLKRFLGQGSVFVDAGANSGYFSLIASALVGKTGKVVSFEPNPLAYRRLTTNIAANESTNISPYMIALTNSAGTALLDMDFPEDGFATIVTSRREMIQRHGKDQYQTEIRTDTLDQVIGDTEPDLIKMDVEGSELLLLLGAVNLIQRSKNLKLVMEYRAYYENHALRNFLKNHFRIFKIRLVNQDLRFEEVNPEAMGEGERGNLLLYKK